MHAVLVVVGLVAFGGCKLRFDEVTDAGSSDATLDAPPDALVAHDEDGDGVLDHLDTCPHIVTPQTDDDGDGVGNTCDPEPAVSRQSIALFDPLLGGSAFTVITGAWTETGDGYRVDTATQFGELVRPFVVSRGIVEIGVNVHARAPAATQYQVSVSLIDALTLPYYYVELYETVAPGYVALSYFDGAAYMPVKQQSIAGSIPTGRARLLFTVVDATPSVGYEVFVGTASFNDSNPTPGYAGATQIYLGAQGLDVELEYLIVIATN